jgi:hydroxymethylglutaryl-CoA synthase
MTDTHTGTDTDTGIVRYGSYVPAYRVSKTDIAAALGERAPGQRAVASHDQDTTTLGVEAAASVVRDRQSEVRSLWFATTAPAYVDKTNATTVHAALQLDDDIAAVDLGATLRSGASALLLAARSDGLAVLADMRGGAAGGADERNGADAATAFLFGAGSDVVARLVATASATAEFVDRWRAPGEAEGQVWEERFGVKRYAELTQRVLDSLAKQIDLTSIDVFAVVSGNPRAAVSAGGIIGSSTGGRALDTRPLAEVGYAGAAHIGLALADWLDTAGPEETMLVLSLADGADAMVLTSTAELAHARGRTVRQQAELGVGLSYPQYLVWRGRLTAERPRRPDPQRTSAPFAWRNREYKLALQGGRCRKCGAVQYPLPSVCYRCASVDDFDVVAGAGELARIVTFTVDRLAFSPSPPLVSAVVQFDTGGRIQCELTEVHDDLEVGMPVVPTFRVAGTVDGIRNYLWKARPITAPERTE